MLYVTYKQWVDGTQYTDGYLGAFTSRFETKEDFHKSFDNCIQEGNPMIITGIWEI